jgi:lycopene beta-cyclase
LKDTFTYDLAIIGAGAAGLHLLYEFVSDPANKDAQILLIDSGDRSKKSWCFWEGKSSIFPFLIEKQWPNLAFVHENGSKSTFETAPLAYNYISSERFFTYFFTEFIPQFPQIHHVMDKVLHVSPSNEIRLASETTYTAKIIADSRIKSPQSANPNSLYQHFYGKFIHFDAPVLDPETATMMDFSMEQISPDFTCFHYILPFSSTYGLIETTVFSKKAYDKEKFQSIWDAYMLANFPQQTYTIEQDEMGTIPMCQQTISMGTKTNFPIGTAAGMVKPSTGYAFARMNQDAKRILTNQDRRSAGRFSFYDRLLLHIIKHETHQIPAVMSRLFRTSPIQVILHFLDEKTSIWTELGIFAKLDIALFLKQLFKSYVWKR